MTASDLLQVRRRLADWYEPKEIEIWLDTPHPQLRNHCPIDVIHQGRVDEVIAILDRLDSGAYL